MIKEWIRNFCGYDLLKNICDDIRHDVAKLFGDVYEIDGNKKISKLHKLTDTCNKADRTNEEAIKFLLKHIKVDKKFFNEYKYTPYKDLPWYLQEIFNNLYKVDKIIYYSDYSGIVAIASPLTGIIATDSDCIGKIIEVVNELSDK